MTNYVMSYFQLRNNVTLAPAHPCTLQQHVVQKEPGCDSSDRGNNAR